MPVGVGADGGDDVDAVVVGVIYQDQLPNATQLVVGCPRTVGCEGSSKSASLDLPSAF